MDTIKSSNAQLHTQALTNVITLILIICFTLQSDICLFNLICQRKCQKILYCKNDEKSDLGSPSNTDTLIEQKDEKMLTITFDC